MRGLWDAWTDADRATPAQGWAVAVLLGLFFVAMFTAAAYLEGLG